MTTTAPTPPWSPRVAAWTAAAGGLCFLLGFGLTPWESWDDTQAYHDGLAANAGRTELSTVLCFLALLSLAPTAVSVLCRLRRRGRGRAVAAGAALAGAATMPGLLVSDFYDLTLAQRLDHAQSAQLADAAREATGAAVLQAGFMFGLIGILALLIFLWRDGIGSWAAPALWLAGWGMELFELSTSTATGVLSGVFLCGALVLTARALRPTASRLEAAPELRPQVAT